jgi:hypothetical protein
MLLRQKYADTGHITDEGILRLAMSQVYEACGRWEGRLLPFPHPPIIVSRAVSGQSLSDSHFSLLAASATANECK